MRGWIDEIKVPMSKQLRICIVSPHSYPLFKEGAAASAGGAEAQLKALGTALHALGHDVHFIVDDFGQSDRVEESGVALHKVPLRYMGGSNLHLPADWLRFIRALFVIDADVHLMKVPRNLLLPLAVFARVRRRKVIYVGQRDVDATKEGARSADRLPSYLFYRGGLAMVDAVVAQTASQQRNFLSSLGKAATVIPNVVTLPEMDVAGKSNYVLWVGNSSHRKQPEKFLEVVRALPDISFRMIMAPSNERPDDDFIASQARDLPNIEYLGFVPFQKIMDEYRGARLFVSTSLSEGFPNTFLQSWQYGTPVVSLHVDPDGVIGRHLLGKVSGTLDKLIGDVRALYSNDDEWARLSANSADYVRDNHSLAAVVDQYLALFQRLGLPL